MSLPRSRPSVGLLSVRSHSIRAGSVLRSTMPVSSVLGRAALASAVQIEALEPRRLFNTVSPYLPDPQGPFFYAPAPSPLYEPTSRLTSAEPRLFLPEVPVSVLQARAASPAYATLWNKVNGRANTFRSTAIPATAPNVNTEDPYRGWATNLLTALTAYYASPTGSVARTNYLTTISNWVNQFRTWWGPAPAAGAAPGSVTPRADLAISLLTEFHAIAYDWTKNDPAFAGIKDNLRTNLINLVRTLRYDQDNGGGAAQWVGNHRTNHNTWNYYALLAAGVVLHNDPSGAVPGTETLDWIDKGLRNYWIATQYLNTGGSPHEGYSYDAFAQNTYFMPAYIERAITQVGAVGGVGGWDPLAMPAFTNQGIARAQQLIPDNYGAWDWAQGGYAADMKMHWGFHMLGSLNNDPVAQWVGNYVSDRVSNTFVEWQSMFFFDPAKPAADVTQLPTYYNDTNFGLFSARTNWNLSGAGASSNVFFGMQAGPFDGWNNTYRDPILGNPQGHTLPSQGNLTLYVGNKPILPIAGYPRDIAQTNHNTVLFDARDGQADTDNFTDVANGSVVVSTSIQNGGGGQFYRGLGSFADQTDHARMLSFSNVGGVHTYLADLGGVYRLNDNREPSGVVRPDYQRRVFFLPSGALAIVDRVRTSQPRDLTFWLPIHNGTATLNTNPDGQPGVGVESVMNFTTAAPDNVAGKVLNYTTMPGTTASVVDAVSTSWPITSESLNRKVFRIQAPNRTEAVFAVVLGIGTAADNVALQADANGVTFEGVYYPWDRARRGGPAVHDIDADIGYVLGEELGGMPELVGTARWTSNGNPRTNERLAVVREDPDGNRVISTEPWSSAPTRMAFGWLRYSPLPQDLGVESLNQAPVVTTSFRFRLDDANQGVANNSWTIEPGRVVSGANQGRTYTLILLTDGRLRATYGTNQATTWTSPTALTPGQWNSISTTLNYTAKTFDLVINGTTVLTGASFAETAPTGFGRFSFSAPGTQANYRRISFDDFSITRAGEPPVAPTGMSVSAAGSATLAWLDHSTDETGFQLQRSTSPTFATATLISLPADTRTYGDSDPTLVPGTAYFYRVRAVNGMATSAFSDAVRVVSAASEIATPSQLTATADSPASVTLTWALNAPATTAVVVQRARAADGIWFTVAVPQGQPTTFTDTTAQEGTAYLYRVASVVNAGNSAYTTPVAVSTPLAAPFNASAVGTGVPLQVSIVWANASSNLAGTRVERSADDGQTWGVVGTAASAATSFVDSVPVVGTYRYRLTAVGAAPDSQQVVTNAVTLSAGPPSITTPAMVVSQTATTAQLSVVATDDGGPGNLSYAWSVLTGPGSVTFAPGNSATPVATFTRAGTYTLRVTVTDSAGLTAASDVGVTFASVPSSIGFDDLPPYLLMGATRQLIATVKDPFGQPVPSQPAVRYAKGAGPGLVSEGGLFTPLAEGLTTLTAEGGGFSVSATVPVTYALTVANVLINQGAAQRSMVTSVQVVFSKPVMLEPGAVTLTRRADATPVTFSLAPTGDGRALTLTFPNTIGGSLADGLYDLRLNSAMITDALDQPLAPGDRTFTFRRLFGDANGNGIVDTRDRTAFLSALNSSTGQPAYRAFFDFDASGTVDSLDHSEFDARFAG